MTSLSAAPASPAPVAYALPALLIGQLAVTAAPILVRLTGQPALDSAAGRMWTAVPVLILWSLLAPRPAQVNRWTGTDMLLAVLAGVAFAGDLAGMHLAIALSSVTNATFLVNLAPILMVLASWALWGQRPTGRQGLALAIAGAGTLGLTLDTGGRAGADPLGDAAGLGSAVAFAAYLLLVARLRLRHGTGPVMLWTSLACAVTLLPLSLLDGEFDWPVTAGGLAAMLALGILVHAFGQGLTAIGLGSLPAPTVGAMLLLQPVATAAAVPLILGEMPSLPQVVGAGLVLLALSLTRFSKS